MMNFRINLEYFVFTQPMAVDEKNGVYVTYLYHEKNINEIYGLIFTDKKKSTHKYYREVDCKPDEREHILIDYIEKYIGNQVGIFTADMGLNVKMNYTVEKKDKEGNIVDTHKGEATTVKKL